MSNPARMCYDGENRLCNTPRLRPTPGLSGRPPRVAASARKEGIPLNDTYPAFRKTGIDLAPLGMGQRPETETYFCTPRGARIFGWAGVDGIHFCFIRGFGEMVFAVSPMNLAPHYVHPLARNF